VDAQLGSSPKDALAALLGARRSYRSYRPDPVPNAVIERLIEAACRAPSAHNRQPWRFAVLKTADEKFRLADAMATRLRRDQMTDGDATADVEGDATRSMARIAGAPLLVLVALSMADMDCYPDLRRNQAEHTMAVQSVALATGNLLLAVTTEGFGACWMCGPLFCPDVVSAALDLPPDWEPQALITVGKPHGASLDTPRRSRKPATEVTRGMESEP
jgi:F420 biosynthesis protein FbiB-like protein